MGPDTKERKNKRVGLLILVLVVNLMVMACIPGIDLFGSGAGEKAVVTGVNVVTTGGRPSGYVAQTTGYLPDTCTQIGRTSQAVVRTTIRVTLYTRTTDKPGCVPQQVPFREQVRLNVDGLKAGSYAVDVNGTVASFTVMEDH